MKKFIYYANDNSYNYIIAECFSEDGETELEKCIDLDLTDEEIEEIMEAVEHGVDVTIGARDEEWHECGHYNQKQLIGVID